MDPQRVADRDWSGVARRVDALRFTPRYCPVREPPLSPAEVDDLESWLGLRLPDDYRDFLVQVECGGAGPHDGLRPVRRLPDGGWEWGTSYGDQVDRDLITTAFPTTRMTDDTRITLVGAPPFEENFADPREFRNAFDGWAHRANAGTLARERTAGAICLAQQNIDMRAWLIVSGPARGTVWMDWRDSHGWEDMFPARDPQGQPHTFRSWFLTWLVDVEAAMARSDDA
jgi:hypothetical protein